MYTIIDFKTKKALKEALKRGEKIECYSPGIFPCPRDGIITLEGPHYPQPHRWYARATLKNGIIERID